MGASGGQGTSARNDTPHPLRDRTPTRHASESCMTARPAGRTGKVLTVCRAGAGIRCPVRVVVTNCRAAPRAWRPAGYTLPWDTARQGRRMARDARGGGTRHCPRRPLWGMRASGPASLGPDSAARGVARRRDRGDKGRPRHGPWGTLVEGRARAGGGCRAISGGRDGTGSQTRDGAEVARSCDLRDPGTPPCRAPSIVCRAARRAGAPARPRMFRERHPR